MNLKKSLVIAFASVALSGCMDFDSKVTPAEEKQFDKDARAAFSDLQFQVIGPVNGGSELGHEKEVEYLLQDKSGARYTATFYEDFKTQQKRVENTIKGLNGGVANR